MYLLKGSFDLYITDYCNLHCKECCVLEYTWNNGVGKNITNSVTYEDVVFIIDKLKEFDLQLEQMKFMGGEPTLHRDLGKMIDYAKSSGVVKELCMNTNGLNFTNRVVEAASKLDVLMISVYPLDPNPSNIIDMTIPGPFGQAIEVKKQELHNTWETSEMGKYLESKLKEVQWWYQPVFEKMGVERQEEKYNQRLNWERCYRKTKCKVITTDGFYRCHVSYAERINLQGWTSKQEIINYNESDVPFDRCKTCPQPPLIEDWDSNTLPVDQQLYNKGLDIMKDWSYEKRN